MQKLAIVSLDNQDLHNDSRVLRQIKYLSTNYDLYVYAFGNTTSPIPYRTKEITIVGSLTKNRFPRMMKTLVLLPLGKLFGRKVYDFWYWNRPGHRQVYNALIELKPDFIHANDWWSLPVCACAAKITNSKLVMDFHEYALGEYASRWWKIFYAPCVEYFINTYVSSADRFVTVSETMAQLYREELHINPIVVMNTPEMDEKIHFRPSKPNNIRLVNHGVVSRTRPLEPLIDITSQLHPKYSVYLILLGDSRYIKHLRRYAKERAPDRIFFPNPVPPKNLIQFLSNYDLGIYLLNPTNKNHYSTIPNKFFEFINAGLGIITTNVPELKRITLEEKIGAIFESNNLKELIVFLNNLTVEQIDQFKQCAIRARRKYNAIVELRKLIDLYADLAQGNIHGT